MSSEVDSRPSDAELIALAAEVAAARHINRRLGYGIGRAVGELLRARARLATLEARLAEATGLLDDAMRQGAIAQPDALYDSGGLSTWCAVGDYLAAHAGWHRWPGGHGRRWWYSPPERDPAATAAPLAALGPQDSAAFAAAPLPPPDPDDAPRRARERHQRLATEPEGDPA